MSGGTDTQSCAGLEPASAPQARSTSPAVAVHHRFASLYRTALPALCTHEWHEVIAGRVAVTQIEARTEDYDGDYGDEREAGTEDCGDECGAGTEDCGHECGAGQCLEGRVQHQGGRVQPQKRRLKGQRGCVRHQGGGSTPQGAAAVPAAAVAATAAVTATMAATTTATGTSATSPVGLPVATRSATVAAAIQ